MTRHPSPLVISLTLLCGVLLGALLGRGAPTLSAQAKRSEPAATPAAKPPEAARATSEEALYEQLTRQYAQFEHVNRTFELVARAVSPAVVHIVAAKTGRVDERSRVKHYEESGSGVIVRGERGKNLYVLSNNHVVENSLPAKISIFLQDGRSLHPDQIWLDAKADIAVMSLNRNDLPAARLGNSDEAAVGSWVLALGSPFGLTHSVSQGIISARGRHMDDLPDVENQDFLQTDAAINPGNSGGPLVNLKGEVIGINNSIASNGGGNEGVGFSIPINLARWIMAQLVSKGRVTRGALGIDLHPEFRPEDAITVGLEKPHGAWVDVVHPSSPAAQGGLRSGDVIVSFQGVEVHDLNHLINMVSMAPIGQPADLVVWRVNQRLNLRVTVGDRDRTIAAVSPTAERPAAQKGDLVRRPDLRKPPATALGVQLQTVDEPTAKSYSLSASVRGALVLKIAPDSPLDKLLQPLDVIYSVNGHGVATADEAVKALNTDTTPEGLLIGYDRVVKGVVERRSVKIP